jgi:hypothetical protein
VYEELKNLFDEDKEALNNKKGKQNIEVIKKFKKMKS